MSLDTLLTIALDAAFFAAFGFTLLDYLRHEDLLSIQTLETFVAKANRGEL